MNLPPALAPWGPYLQDFPLAFAPILGQMAQRLAALMGPSGQEFDQPEGEVDGYDGLARRGLPERMLLSDWLLAQEAPDEWARRAAEGELSYLQLARRAPQISQVVTAIFDAGPDVLGSPRLAQMAALIVLARRAREMGAELQWGIAQKPSSQIFRDLTPSGVLALLEARGSVPITESDLEHWRKELGGCDECWLVGGKAISELASVGESRLLFEDPFEEGNALDVTAHTHHGAVRHARLQLPNEAICARLLRDPFGTVNQNGPQVRRVKEAFIPNSNLVWLNGNSLAARSKSGGVLFWRVPSSPRGGVAKPKHYYFGGQPGIDYVGYYNGAITMAQIHEKWVLMQKVGGKAQSVAAGIYGLKAESLKDYQPGSKPLQILWSFDIGQYQPFFVLPDGSLCRLVVKPESETSQRGEVEGVSKDVTTSAAFEKALVGLSGSNPARIVKVRIDFNNREGFTKEETLFNNGEVTNAFWGFSSYIKGGYFYWGACAYQTGQGWFLQWSNNEGTESNDLRHEKMEVRPDETVLGVGGWKNRWPTPGLLIMGPNNQGLSMRGIGWQHLLVTGREIQSASVSSSTPYVAWMTENELTVYSLELDIALARWQWGETA